MLLCLNHSIIKVIILLEEGCESFYDKSVLTQLVIQKSTQFLGGPVNRAVFTAKIL